MKKTFKRLLRQKGIISFPLLTLLLSAVPAITQAASPGGDAKAPPPPTVAVTTISRQDVTPATEYVGHVEAIQAVDLRARVEGFLEKVNFQEGQSVTAGEILYVIEQAPYKAQVDAERARLAEARAELHKAEQHLARLRDARPESFPATDMDNAMAAELTTKARVVEAEAALAVAELRFSYTTIKAPISGRLGRTNYTVGNLVNPASGPLARIVQLDPIRVVYFISENDLPAIQTALHDAAPTTKNPLLTPSLRLAGGKVAAETGQVDFVDNHVDPATGSIAVRAIFANHDGLLLPGQYVTALLKESAPRLMPLVPQGAVTRDQQGSSVLLVNEANQVVVQPITIGPAFGTMWVVEEGLTGGERVIVQGIQKVRPGQTVQVAIGKPEEARP